MDDSFRAKPPAEVDPTGPDRILLLRSLSPVPGKAPYDARYIPPASVGHFEPPRPDSPGYSPGFAPRSVQDAARSRGGGTKKRWFLSPSTGRAARISKIVLRVFGILVALALLGILIHVYVGYESSKYSGLPESRPASGLGEALAPVWTRNLHLYPMWIFIGATAFSLLGGGALLITYAIPKLRKFGPIITMIVAALALGLVLTALVYLKSYDQSAKKWWDIWSWTCKRRFVTSHVNMVAMCGEMWAAWYLGIVLGVVEFVSLCLVGWDAVSYARSKKYSKLQAQWKG